MRHFATGLTAATAVAAGLGIAAAAEPQQVPGNPKSCAPFLDTSEELTEVKIDPARSVTRAGVVLTLSSNGKRLSWNDSDSENFEVVCIIVKGGPNGANVYTYDPEVPGDEDLTAPPLKFWKKKLPKIGHYIVAAVGTTTPPPPTAGIGFLPCPFNAETTPTLAQVCAPYLGPGGEGKAAIYFLDGADPEGGFFDEESDTFGPIQCLCGSATVAQCDEDAVEGDDACVSPSNPVFATPTILDFTFNNDPCVTIGGRRVCNTF